jgi:hypothetical protein
MMPMMTIEKSTSKRLKAFSLNNILKNVLFIADSSL